MAWAILMGHREVSTDNTHAQGSWLYVQTNRLLSLLVTNGTFLKSLSRPMQCEKGCSVLLVSVLPSPPQCLCAGLACAMSHNQTLPHTGQHLSSFPSGEKAAVSVCVFMLLLTTCGSICMLGQRSAPSQKAGER